MQCQGATRGLSGIRWEGGAAKGQTERGKGFQPRKEQRGTEVLVGALGEPLLLKWLDHIVHELETKPYTKKHILDNRKDALRVQHDGAL